MKSDESAQCLFVELGEARPNFFSELTGVDSTLLKESEQKHLPIGFGPFVPSDTSVERLTLTKSKNATGDIDTLVFETLSPTGESISECLEQRFDEWNFYNGVADSETGGDTREAQVRPTVKTMVVWTSMIPLGLENSV